MDSNPPPARPHYTWPKYLLAAVSAFLLVCVVWTMKEVQRVRRIKRESQNSPPPALLIESNHPGAGAAP